MRNRRLKALPQENHVTTTCHHRPHLRNLAYGALGVSAIAAVVYYGSMQGARRGFDGQSVTVDVVDARNAIEYHNKRKSA